MKKETQYYLIITPVALLVVALVLSFSLSFSESMRLVFGSVYIIFLPGFALTWVFWEKEKISSLERFMLSVTLSIAIVPLAVFLLNKLGALITSLNIFLTVLGILAVSAGILILRKKEYF